MLRFRSLVPLLATAFLLMALLPLVAVIGIAHTSAVGDNERAAGSKWAIIADSALDKMYRNLFERYGDVQAFALNPLAASGDQAALTALANDYTDLYDIYDVIVIADTDGRILATNTRDLDGKDISARMSGLVGTSLRDRDWFAKALAVPAGTTDYGDAAKDPLAARATGGDGIALRFSAPIRKDGKVVGLWTNLASWSRVVKQIAEVTEAPVRAEHVRLTMIDRAGAVLIDGNQDMRYDPSVNLKDLGVEAARLGAGSTGGPSRNGYTVETNRRTGKDQVNGWAWRAESLGFPGYGWTVLMRQHRDDAVTQAYHLFYIELAVALVAIALAVVVGIWLARSIVRPLQAVESVMGAVAAGDLTRKVEVHGGQEVGRLADSTNRTVEQLRAMVGQISQSSSTLGAAAEELAATATQLVETSGQTNQQATAVSAAAEQVSANVATVASGAEEMSASVKEIAGGTANAARVASDAAAQARQSDAIMSRLGEASAKVGEVVATISAIAEQTNLLALNATIEAARAGEAGRGFAVVANEVKELARQTATATDDIRSRIGAIQTDIQATVGALGAISKTIEAIDGTQHTISAAVEEQSATTNEMTRNLAQASEGSTEIAKQIQGVAAGSQAVSHGAGDTQRAAGELSRLAAELRELVGRMRV